MGKPIKENDHALDALRYLVSGLDIGFLARVRKWLPQPKYVPVVAAPPVAVEPRPQRKWLSIHNEALWTTLFTIRRD
jgi:hypothetical protein